MTRPAFVPCFNKYGQRRYYPQRATTLYYVKFSPPNRPPVYKVGITTTSIDQRFIRESIKPEVLFTVQYKGGRLAYMEEQRILNEYSEYLLGDCKILSSGNSEIFGVDIRKYSNKGNL